MAIYKSECRKLQYVLSKNKSNVTNNECETSDSLFLACQVTVQVPNKYVWLVDSGCSNHMISHSDLFSHLETSFSSSIGLGDDRQVKASRNGIVPVLTKQNVVKNIYDGYYVPN